MAPPAAPPPQRRYGIGSVEEIAPGSWRLRVYVGSHPVTGKPIQRSQRFRGTRPAAEKALLKLRAKAEQEKHAGVRATTPTKVTVAAVLDAHLAASRNSLAPGTLAAYDSARKLHVPEGFGKKRVDALTSQSFRDLYAWLEEQGLSDASIWKVYALMSGALTRAVREHGVDFDSKLMVTPRKPTARKRQMATDEELARLLRASASLGDEWPFLLRLACATGMRRGELVALRWSSLDGHVLYVDASVVATEGLLLSKSTKTGHARYVHIDDVTAECWASLHHARNALLAPKGVDLARDSFVFAGVPDGSRPIRPDRISKVWDALRTDLSVNPKLEFRALRNWHISTLDALGFDLAKIGRRVGHSQPNSATAMTSHYSLAEQKVDAEMAVAVGVRLAQIDEVLVQLSSD